MRVEVISCGQYMDLATAATYCPLSRAQDDNTYHFCNLHDDESYRPDPKLSCEEVFAGGAPALLAALGEELPVARHEVAVAVDDLAPVVDRPAQARSLISDGFEKLL